MRLQAVVFIACFVALCLAFSGRATPTKQIHPDVCSAHRAVAFYSGRISYWSHRMGTAVLERRALQAASPSDGPGRCPRYLAHILQRKSYATRRKFRSLSDPKRAITYVFKSYAQEALGVAYCESRLHVTAENGQYLGLFQMGSSERRLFGHGPTALEQAIAANRYFIQSGRDWSPWSCRWAA